MIEKYKTQFPIAYQIIKNTKERNIISHAYMITNDENDSLDFAKDVAKFLLYTEEETVENIKIIDPEGLVIKKEEIDNLQNEFKTTSLISSKKIYIINKVERLNKIAANSLLKFLEEPEENIIAILTTKNIDSVLSTIKSRCLEINLIPSRNERLDIISFLSSQNLNVPLEKIEELYKGSVSLINSYETNGINVLIEKEELIKNKTKEEIIVIFDVLIIYYKEQLNKLLKLPTNYNLENVEKTTTKEIIIDKLKKILELKKSITGNANISLLVDKLIIELDGIDKLCQK